MRPRVLLVEGDEVRSREIHDALASRFECWNTRDAGDARQALQEGEWAAVVSGIHPWPDLTGLEALQIARETIPRAFRLLYANGCSPSLLSDARRLSEVHFVGHEDGVPLTAQLEAQLEELLEPPSLEVPADLPSIAEDGWIVRSPAGKTFLLELRRAAERDIPVYLHGEPGTGRWSAARKLRQWRRELREHGALPPANGDPVALLRVPPLRERPQDLPILAAQCLRERTRHGGCEHRLGQAALDELLGREWRGNVAELLRVMMAAARRAGDRPEVEPADLPAAVDPPLPPSQTAKDDGQRTCLLWQLRVARTVSGAARLEGCTRANYIRLMRRLGILRADVDAARDGDPTQ